MRAAPRLLFLPLLTLLSRSGADSGEDPETAVPPVKNVVIKSLDFKTLLHWDYVSMPLTPRFTVEIKSYLIGVYQPVTTCMNIRKRKCDLSKEIKTPLYSHWARVKALIESEESEYVETKEFILRRDGKISPPKLMLSTEDDKIKVNLYHLWKLPPFDEVHCPLNYRMFFRHNKEIVEIETKECKRKCSTNITASSPGSTYCVSAKGLSWCVSEQAFPKSNESCIYVPSKQQLDLNIIIIGVAVVIGVGLILATSCVCKQLKRKIELPKSLVTVVRNLNSRNFFESRPDAKYLSVITSSPCKSDSISEEVNIMERVSPDEERRTLNPEDCSEETGTISSQEISNETEEMSIQESTAEMAPDDDQSPRVKENYFHSDSSQTELCGIPSNPEPSNTKMQECMDLRSCNMLSGYDKPHVPLNLLDVGEEESVIAYKHTDEVKG